MIYPPNLCFFECQKKTFNINETKKIDIINLNYLKCSNKSCKYKISIREFSILKFIKRIHASIAYQILMLFIIEKKSAKNIQKSMKKEI